MIKKKLALIIAVLALVVGLYSLPVMAEKGSSSGSGHGSDDSTSTSTSTSSGSSDDSSVDSTSNKSSNSSNDDSSTDLNGEAEMETEIEMEAHHQTRTKIEDGLHSEADDIINGLLTKHSKHSESERQKNCLAAEQGLESKLGNLSKNATKFQSKIDKALVLSLDYQKTNNITIDNFDTLVSSAKDAQSKSAAAVTVLNGLSTNLDCTNSNVATNVAEFKAAAKQARDSLLVYKGTVKAILVALAQAKESN